MARGGVSCRRRRVCGGKVSEWIIGKWAGQGIGKWVKLADLFSCKRIDDPYHVSFALLALLIGDKIKLIAMFIFI